MKWGDLPIGAKVRSDHRELLIIDWRFANHCSSPWNHRTKLVYAEFIDDSWRISHIGNMSTNQEIGPVWDVILPDDGV